MYGHIFSIFNVGAGLFCFSGLLDVCIRYKHRPVRPEGQTGRGAASRIVTLVVQVHRASGLQAAARYITTTVFFLIHLFYLFILKEETPLNTVIRYTFFFLENLHW